MTEKLDVPRYLEAMCRLAGKKNVKPKTLKLKVQSSRTFTRPKPPELTPRETRAAAVGNYLKRRYPDLFQPAKPVVLAIGIHKKLTRPEGASLLDLRRFLKAWTTREAYLQQIARGGSRRGTAGKDGEITPKQIKCARFMLKRMRKQ